MYPLIYAAEWAKASEWLTADERSAQDKLDELDEAHRPAVEAFRARRVALLEAREAARTAAHAAERRLITENSDALVGEVAVALREFGFEAVDSDSLPQHQTGKQEDLRVTDDTWIALVEVKGYRKRNAKIDDLMQLGKAAEEFVVAEGQLTDARWYVVNQAFDTPPHDRKRPFANSPSGLLTFASSHGLVIDTRDLFRLREAVRCGNLDAGAARQLLKTSTGVLEYPLEAVDGDLPGQAGQAVKAQLD